MNQVAIDLDEVGPDLGDDEHARVPGTGVIDRDPESARAQIGHDAAKTCDVGHRNPLADLQHDVLGTDPGIIGELRQPFCRIGLRQRRQHHVEEQRRGQRVNASGEPRANAGLVELLLHRLAGGVEQSLGTCGPAPGLMRHSDS